jgi:hypothetical protein
MTSHDKRKSYSPSVYTSETSSPAKLLKYVAQHRMGKASELLLGTKRGDTDEVNIQ